MARGTAAAALIERHVEVDERGPRPRASGKFLFRGAGQALPARRLLRPLRGRLARRSVPRTRHGTPRLRADARPRRQLLPHLHPATRVAARSGRGVRPGRARRAAVDRARLLPRRPQRRRRHPHAGRPPGSMRCKQHPAVFAFLIGNEIPPDIVRWHQPERVKAFLHELYDLVKRIAPDVLVSYANFPPTEYLDLDFLDFISFNVYLHREHDFRRYLSRLQNLAQATSRWCSPSSASIRCARAPRSRRRSCRGRCAPRSSPASPAPCIFSWTDDWFTGGFQVEDWAFGLVDRERHKKPAYHAVQKLYAGQLPPPLDDPPRISVVICAYNAERTMDACLASLRTLRYPNYEVIVVNDGSTDRTLEISQRYPEVRIISQENKGLSVARNVGIEHATGEIVAYTDSDCVVDPDWLTYLAYKFVHSGFVAVGGPNLPPPEESRIAACVAASPGGPTHVLIDDEVAEHIPGCNMAFPKTALQADRRLRSAASRRRRRRRPVLALAERRPRHRLQPGRAWSGTSAATRSRRTSSSRWATARRRRSSTSSIRSASTCSGNRSGSAASTATSACRCSRAARSSTTASSAAACSRRCTNRRRRCSPTCPSRWSGTSSAWCCSSAR